MDAISQMLFFAAAGSGRSMVLVFDTTLATGTTVVVPLQGPHNVVINWGDGTTETFSSSQAEAAVTNRTRTYASEGEYTVTVEGTAYGFGGNTARPNLTKCRAFGDLGLESLRLAFFSCANLVEVPTTVPSSVTRVASMFTNATSFNQDIGGWDVSNVIQMTDMFRGATSFNQDIGGWDVSNVTDLVIMFSGATSFNQDIGGWDVSNVTELALMFFGATSFNQDIGGWDVSNVTTMGSMFSGATSFNQNISGWDVSGVVSMGNMFKDAAAFNQNLSGMITGLTSQPVDFSLNANATFANNANNLKPLLANGVTRINT